MIRRLVILVSVMGLAALFVVPAAHGAFGIAKWSAITCNANEDTPEVKPQPEAPLPPVTGNPPPQAAGQCNTTTPAQWFTQAAGHPNFAFTDFTLNQLPAGLIDFPDGFVKDIIVDTPEGLSVNPEALPQCTLTQLGSNACPEAALVGVNYFTVALEGPPACATYPPPGVCLNGRVAVPVYNLVPDFGVPSMVGFLTTSGITKIVGSLDPVDQHVIFTISDIHAPPAGPPVVGSRLVFNGVAGNGTYLTNPSECGVKPITSVEMDQHAAPGVFVQKPFETAVPVDGCAAVPFDPTVKALPQGDAVDSPEATEINVGIPFNANAPIANSYLKTAKVVLPEGTSLNPASANGLQACTNTEFGKGTNDPIACPNASRIGTVEVQTPSLPADSLTGTVYVGQPLSNNSSTGEQFRIFIHAGSERYAVNVRLEGKVYPDPVTGQLTAIVDGNPQATFSSFKLRMNGGSKGTLTSPPICGPHTTHTVMTPWSGQANAEPESSFTLTSDPQGGACPATLGARRFTPTYSARSSNSLANAYSPFNVHIGRADGEQELKVVDVTLPKGHAAKIAGIPYCSEAALTAAAAQSGTAELAAPSCSSASEVGVTTTAAGSGGNPIKIAGKAYLAGPYNGAPLSLAVVTPAVAGPYDLGTVVVRVALNVNPETTAVTGVSDPIPNILGGVRLDIRSIDIDLNRSGFMHNPTNCKTNPATGVIKGGGSNPADPAVFSSYPVSTDIPVTDCGSLAFGPKLGVKLLGGRKATKRKGHPAIQATLTQKESESNIAYTALTLPKTMLLDNSHFKTICTRVQLAASACPAAAQYGTATATSPLLSGDLSGPVYLVSSSDKLPNLVADLRGQINVQLRGVITSVKGAMKTTFPSVPDAPVTKFVLKMDGGAKGLIQNSKDFCKSPSKGKLNIKGQNDKTFKNNKYALKTSCPKKKKK